MIDRKSGQTLTGWAIYAHRIEDVLTTQVGERIRRRGYGSKLPKLQGKPLSAGNLARVQVWTAEAFHNAENGLNDGKLETINVSTGKTGFRLKLDVHYQGELKELSI